MAPGDNKTYTYSPMYIVANDLHITNNRVTNNFRDEMIELDESPKISPANYIHNKKKKEQLVLNDGHKIDFHLDKPITQHMKFTINIY